MRAVQTERELIERTRPYAIEDKPQSWRAVISTLVFQAGALAAAFAQPVGPLGWGIRVLASVTAGMLIVRMFILFHDFQHGALLRGSKLAKAILNSYAVLVVLTPPRVWRETHNYHHAHTAKIIGSNVGSYMMVTTAMWRQMTPSQRFMYRAIRHPLTILFGYFTIFIYGMCISPFMRAPKKHWLNPLVLVIHAALVSLVVWKLGVAALIFGVLLPQMLAMATGSYLFYAQHNFPDMHVQPRESWSFGRAALESSSYMEMGPVMNYFTGNIGYHHVHHLNPTIPFYRLPRVMADIPELQTPGKTSLRPRDIAQCFRLKLWDPEAQTMVSYEDADRARAASTPPPPSATETGETEASAAE
jgi:omega-6 fatty acid desaturase (delta-12 desaturase)